MRAWILAVAMVLTACGDGEEPREQCAHTECDGPRGYACVDLASDQEHCGACNSGCPSSEMCVQGSCLPRADVNGQCEDGYVNCAGACVLSDESNCGACGNRCEFCCLQDECIVSIDAEWICRTP